MSRLSLRAKTRNLEDRNSYLLTNKEERERVQAYEVLPGVTDHDATHPLQRANPGLLNVWRSELVGCFVMIGMLAAIIGILAPNDGKPLPQWPFHISINTLIAVLTTVLKACALLILADGISQLKWEWFTEDRPLHDLVLFDEASRGPWGCVRLIFSGRGGHLVASLGALLVILNLAIDPFTQQVIRYYDCTRISTDTQATLPRSLYYDGAAAHTSAGTWPPETAILGYIDQGIYNPSALRTPFVCASGNCTFSQPFSTIGFCAQCEDMSSQLTFKNVTTYRNILNTTTNRTEPALSGRWVNTTLPSGSYAATGPGSGSESWFSLNSSSGWINIIQASHAFPGAVPDPYWDHYYANIMRPPKNIGCNTTYDNSTWACQGFGGSGAARCKFNPCVRTYAANVEETKLEEKLIRTDEMLVVNDPGQNMPLWIAADLQCAGETVRTRLADVGFNINNDTRIIPWNVMVNDTDSTASIFSPKIYTSISNTTVPGPLLNTTGLPLDIVPPKCIYRMRYWGYSSVNNYLTQYLHGALNPGPNGHSVDGPSQLRALYNDTYASFGSINHTFHSIAEGITLRMRQYQSSASLLVAEAVRGQVIEHDTCVRVRWAYLIFPTAIVLLTVIFLIAMIIITSQSGSAAIAAKWKSSPLPVMFQGLKIFSPGISDGIRDPTKVGLQRSSSMLTNMEGLAKRTTARLNADSNYFD